MFDNRERPLYALCEHLRLQRIAKEDYRDHFNRIANKALKIKLNSEAINRILDLTECHAYYVNVLCDRLWSRGISQLNSMEVDACWAAYVYEERTQTRKELMHLGNAQVKVLIAIALGDNQHLTQQTTQMKLNLTSSAISQALKNLEQKDYIEKREKGSYYLINPLLKASLILYYQDYFNP